MTRLSRTHSAVGIPPRSEVSRSLRLIIPHKLTLCPLSKEKRVEIAELRVVLQDITV